MHSQLYMRPPKGCDTFAVCDIFAWISRFTVAALFLVNDLPLFVARILLGLLCVFAPAPKMSRTRGWGVIVQTLWPFFYIPSRYFARTDGKRCWIWERLSNLYSQNAFAIVYTNRSSVSSNCRSWPSHLCDTRVVGDDAAVCSSVKCAYVCIDTKLPNSNFSNWSLSRTFWESEYQNLWPYS